MFKGLDMDGTLERKVRAVSREWYGQRYHHVDPHFGLAAAAGRELLGDGGSEAD